MTDQLSIPMNVANSSSPDQGLLATHNVASSQGEGEQTTTARPETVPSTHTPPAGQLDEGGGVAVFLPAKDGHDGLRDAPAAPPPPPSLIFNVYGTPIPQGSHKAFVVGGHAKVTEDNKNSRPWRQDLIHAAIAAHAGAPQITGPVEVSVTFVMPRPKYHFRTGQYADLLRDNAPTFAAGKPDCDKLFRNLGDALTASAVIRDDAQIVVIRASKVYADPGDRPGAHVFVSAATS